MEESVHDSNGKPDPLPEHLEQRLHRLENAVASLQDTRALEERVTERVRSRLQSGVPVAAVRSDDKFVDLKRHPLPLAMEAAASRTPASPAETTRQAMDNLPPAARAAVAAVMLPRPRWLLFDVWSDFVAMLRMFLDVRYHVGWFARLTVLVLIPVILTSHLWLWLPVPSLFGLNLIADKLVDLLLAFFLYKTLSREAGRYREWRAQLRR